MSRPGVAVAYRWELRKLAAQKRTYLGLGAMAVLPFVFTVGVAADGGDAEGALFSQVSKAGWPRRSCSYCSAPRSCSRSSPRSSPATSSRPRTTTGRSRRSSPLRRPRRGLRRQGARGGHVRALALALFGARRHRGGHRRMGAGSARSLSGTEIAVPRALALIAGALLAYGPPLLAVASIALLLSMRRATAPRAVVGTLMVVVVMQIVESVPGARRCSPYLLPDQLDRVGRAAPRPDRLGADRARGVGLAALRRAVPGRRGAGVPAPRRDGGLAQLGRVAEVARVGQAVAHHPRRRRDIG